MISIAPHEWTSVWHTEITSPGFVLLLIQSGQCQAFSSAYLDWSRFSFCEQGSVPEGDIVPNRCSELTQQSLLLGGSTGRNICMWIRVGGLHISHDACRVYVLVMNQNIRHISNIYFIWFHALLADVFQPGAVWDKPTLRATLLTGPKISNVNKQNSVIHS